MSHSNNAKSLNECKSHYCGKVFPEEVNKIIKSIHKSMTKKMSASEKKSFNANMAKKMKKNKKEKQQETDSCMKTYCNKGCKETILEDGKEFPKSVELYLQKTFNHDKKSAKIILKSHKDLRKKLFTPLKI